MRRRTLALVCLFATATVGPAQAAVPAPGCVLGRTRSCGLASVIRDALCNDSRTRTACTEYTLVKTRLDAVRDSVEL